MVTHRTTSRNGYNGNKSVTNTRSLLSRFVGRVKIAHMAGKEYRHRDFVEDMGIENDASHPYARRDYARGMIKLAVTSGYVTAERRGKEIVYTPGPKINEIRTSFDRARVGL
jgi:hypothetical protein